MVFVQIYTTLHYHLPLNSIQGTPSFGDIVKASIAATALPSPLRRTTASANVASNSANYSLEATLVRIASDLQHLTATMSSGMQALDQRLTVLQTETQGLLFALTISLDLVRYGSFLIFGIH